MSEELMRAMEARIKELEEENGILRHQLNAAEAENERLRDELSDASYRGFEP